MSVVDLVGIGGPPEEVMVAVEGCVRGGFGMTPRRTSDLPMPSGAFDAARGQYSSPLVLRQVHERRGKDAVRILALTEADLFIPMLSFVFGQAQLKGTAAIVSVARLRQEFYGLPADGRLLTERVVKETLHEMGHTLGIVHCSDTACAMSLSTTVHQIDTKDGSFCPGCSVLLEEELRGLRAGATGVREERT